jgi:hypothetical protein
MYFGDSITNSSTNLEITWTENNVTKTRQADIKIFNSDQVALVKINDMNYFGNLDQVISSPVKYPIGYSPDEDFNSDIEYFYPGANWSDWKKQV